MVEKRLRVNPTLYISESDEWVYLTVEQKVYKVKMTESERKNMYALIQFVNGKHKINQCENEEQKTVFRILLAVNAITERVIDREQVKTITIRRLKHLDNIEELNQYCPKDCLKFASDEDGLYAYLSENELILSATEIKKGCFCKPGKGQQQLLVQAILKNKEEIMEAMSEHSCIAIPLFSYAKGVRRLIDRVDKLEDVVDYMWFQPWSTKIDIDEDSFYPSVTVKCILSDKEFEAIGVDTSYALYQIYREYVNMGAACYE